MATITAAAGGGNWNVGSTWVGGVVPLTTDDVVLNGTSGQVTISANAQCKDINFSGYTNTITFNANLTITGNLTRNTSVFGYLGTGGIIIAGTTTQIINSSIVAWNIPVTFGGASPNISINGAFNIDATLTLSSTTSPVISRANVFDTSENVNPSRDITISGNGIYTGSANIVILGSNNQTLTASGSHQIRNNLTINKTGGVLSLSGTLNYNTGTLSYVASGGTVDAITNNSRLNSSASTTFVTNGIIWNNATFSGNTPIYTLTNNLTLSGTLTLSGQSGTSTTISGADLNVGGLLVTTTSTITGTSVLNFIGTGTWNHTAAGYILKNININTSGTLTLGANIYYSVNTITYISGTVDSSTNSSTLNILLSASNNWLSVTLDTIGMYWYNIVFTSAGGSARTFTITSNLDILNDFVLTNGGIGSTTTCVGNGSIMCNALRPQPSNGNAFTLNFNNNNIYTNDLLTDTFTAGTATTMNNANLYISRNIRIGNSNLLAPFVGTVEIYYVGTGTWTTNQTVANQSIGANFTINTNGVLTLSRNVYFAGANTFTYRNGKVNTKKSTLNITGNSTFVNCNKINFDSVVITAGNTITMNEFFNGSPELQTIISSTSTTNYTIAFTDNFEKIAKFINLNNCTLSRPQQLLMLTNTKKSSTNARGIRYNNQSPNGSPKNDPSVQNQMTYSVPKYLVGDPNMIKSI